MAQHRLFNSKDSHATMTCVNGHKSIGIAKKWRRHRCPHCSIQARVFGPVSVGLLDFDKPAICKVLAGEI